jgi:hypothetical protein
VQTIGPGTAREALGDVCELIEMQVVKDQQLAITRGHDILLEKVSAHAVRQGFGR